MVLHEVGEYGRLLQFFFGLLDNNLADDTLLARDAEFFFLFLFPCVKLRLWVSFALGALVGLLCDLRPCISYWHFDRPLYSVWVPFSG